MQLDARPATADHAGMCVVAHAPPRTEKRESEVKNSLNLCMQSSPRGCYFLNRIHPKNGPLTSDNTNRVLVTYIIFMKIYFRFYAKRNESEPNVCVGEHSRTPLLPDCVSVLCGSKKANPEPVPRDHRGPTHAPTKTKYKQSQSRLAPPHARRARRTAKRAHVSQ